MVDYRWNEIIHDFYIIYLTETAETSNELHPPMTGTAWCWRKFKIQRPVEAFFTNLKSVAHRVINHVDLNPCIMWCLGCLAVSQTELQYKVEFIPFKLTIVWLFIIENGHWPLTDQVSDYKCSHWLPTSYRPQSLTTNWSMTTIWPLTTGSSNWLQNGPWHSNKKHGNTL